MQKIKIASFYLFAPISSNNKTYTGSGCRAHTKKIEAIKEEKENWFSVGYVVI